MWVIRILTKLVVHVNVFYATEIHSICGWLLIDHTAYFKFVYSYMRRCLCRSRIKDILCSRKAGSFYDCGDVEPVVSTVVKKFVSCVAVQDTMFSDAEVTEVMQAWDEGTGWLSGTREYIATWYVTVSELHGYRLIEIGIHCISAMARANGGSYLWQISLTDKIFSGFYWIHYIQNIHFVVPTVRGSQRILSKSGKNQKIRKSQGILHSKVREK